MLFGIKYIYEEHLQYVKHLCISERLEEKQM